MIDRRATTQAALLTALSWLLPPLSRATAQGAAFPTRPLRIVVPYPPGASTDLISRAVAEEAGKRLGQTIIVENRPGGGTVVGTQAVKNAPADGYTLMFQAASLVSNTYTLKNPGYKLSDFTPVTMLSDAAYVMLVPSSLPVKTLSEFIAYAKAHPGKLNYGTLGRGTRTFVLPYRLGVAAGLDWTEISYKGTAEAAQAVMSGDIQTYFSTQAYASTQLESDRLRLLAITSEKRVDFLPNVPTFKELGYPQVTDHSWYALFARSETPKPILDTLRAAFADAMKSAAMQTQLRNNGLSPYDGTLEAFPAKLEAELQHFIAEAKQLGLEPQ
ncbi:tripartite tricarboxylate transporter substrate binding protein [Afipia sp. P52-10]|uniref:Bug family tripartite tricarboxylate transporter substrate binding protein n=1 Tax=Afipia sp. P52-10 TaxID=1429916 RepID=UPI00136330FF|nr:tripartite tricarboxylate transporter substrate binding protein [Afipia sp. P52-10]